MGNTANAATRYTGARDLALLRQQYASIAKLNGRMAGYGPAVQYLLDGQVSVTTASR
jgi:hypothetical protein